MDYHHMTAPCGLDCFNCTFYLAHDDAEAMEQVEKWSEQYNIPKDVMLCKGCREHNGRIPLQEHLFGERDLLSNRLDIRVLRPVPRRQRLLLHDQREQLLAHPIIDSLGGFRLPFHRRLPLFGPMKYH